MQAEDGGESAGEELRGGVCGGEEIGKGVHLEGLGAGYGGAEKLVGPGCYEEKAPFAAKLELAAQGLEALFETFVADDDEPAAKLEGFVANLFLGRAYERGDENPAVEGTCQPFFSVGVPDFIAVGAVYYYLVSVEIA